MKYSKLECQDYLTSELFTHYETNVITAARSQCMRGIRNNFSKMFKSSMNCPLQCETDGNMKTDSQEHILQCSKLSDGKNISYEGIYSDSVETQAPVAKILLKLFRKRQILLEDQEDSRTGLPGASNLDTSSLGTAIQSPV